jgi:hypothetical protein
MYNVNLHKDPYGLGHGILVSGSVTLTDLNGFCYYPIQECSSTIVMENIENGSALNNVFIAGIPIFARITEITQSYGIAILYYSQVNAYQC